MSGWFIATIIVAFILATLLLITRLAVGDKDGISRGAWRGLLAATLGIIALMLFASSATTVPTRSVGVVTSFGRPTGSLTNGFHLVAPWADVEKFDASVQTLKMDGVGKGDTTPCVTVRLGNQTTACVDTSVQWNIRPDGDVVELYRRYKNFDNIETNLVERQLQHALNVAFDTYDPLAAINGVQSGNALTLDELAANARTALEAGVGNGITVLSLTIPLIHYDADTENRLRSYQQALADTRIAEQRKKTAQQVADANNILSGSAATKDPGVQYQNCLNLIADLAAKGQLKDLPPTFNCGQAGSTPVIVGK